MPRRELGGTEDWRFSKQRQDWLLWPLITRLPAHTASLNGSIRDEQNAAVAGAIISLNEKSKRLVLQSKSDAGGFFLFPAIEPGVYSVQIANRVSAPTRLTNSGN